MLAGVAAGVFFAAGCGARKVIPVAPAPALESASVRQLVGDFNRDADAITRMQLKLKLTARAGSHKYTSVTAYLLTQKPSSIRMWGTFTLVGKIFDMASNGDSFELSIPTYNQFYTGLNNVIPAVTGHPLETMRPQVILNALLINPIAPGDHVALDPGSGPAEYELLVLRPGAGGVDRLVRRITFSRYDLLPHAQVLYDSDGVHATMATYSDFTLSDGIPVPQDINIERAVEGYALRLQIVKGGITLNQPFSGPDPFTLKPSAGATIRKLSAAAPGPGGGGDAADQAAPGRPSS